MILLYKGLARKSVSWLQTYIIIYRFLLKNQDYLVVLAILDY